MKQIQWYPGHMAKARRLITEKLKITDIVYELLDARAPLSSKNPELDQILNNKPRLILLNKADLADDSVTEEWLEYFRKKNIKALAVDSLTDDCLKKIYPSTLELLKPLREAEKSKGMKPRPYRAMIIGIPNVGKSQFINNIAGKNKVKTGNIPGVTKNQSYITARNDLILYDNPGVLWPKFENQEVGLNLAAIGSIKDKILPLDEVVMYAINHLLKYYPQLLEKRYNIETDERSPLEIMDMIGEKRGCKASGGLIDYDRVIKIFLNDLRNFKIGKISFERVRQDV